MDQVLRDKGFQTHLATYAGVNLLLIVINITTKPDSYWFFWPLLGWGLGVLGHAYGIHNEAKKKIQ